MASITDCSVGSVSMADLQRVREELLQMAAVSPSKHNRGDDAVAQAITQHDEQPIVVHTSERDRDIDATECNIPDPLQELNAVAPRIPTSALSPEKSPRLQLHKSASAALTGNMESDHETSIPNIKFTKAATFNGRNYADTQPMESQVYRELSESIMKPAASEPNMTDTPMFQHTEDTFATGPTPHTLREGDTGYIDLGAAFQPASQGRSSNADFDDLFEDTSPQTQLQVPGRLVMPVTPTVAGNKHGRDGELLPSTVSRTPAYSQLFAGQPGAPLLSATQLFNQTQAPSSPLVDALRSDPVVSRPSPNLHNAEPTSPPAVTFSSPIASMNVRPTTSSGEPRETYTSMRESQERRAEKMRMELGLTGVVGEDEEEDLFGIGRPLVGGRGPRRALSAQPIQHLLSGRMSSKLETPQLSRRKSGSMVNLVTPGTSHRGERIDFDEDDELLSAEEEDREEDAIEQDNDDGEARDGVIVEDEDDHAMENSDADDEYDELGQTVLHSQGNMPDEDDPDSGDDGRPGEDEEEVEDEQDEDETTEDQAVEEQIRAEHIQSQRAAADEGSHLPIPGNTQRSAIADSQSGSSRKRRRQAPPPSGPNSSITSFIPGSQYAGKTSQELAFIRRVHNDSQAVSSADRVPSSPPPMPVLNEEASSHGSGVVEAQTTTGDESHQQYEESAAPQESRLDISEIPESEYTEHENTVARQQSNITNILNSVQEGSHSNALLYSTARTHVSSASPSPTKHDSSKMATTISASQMSRPSQFSPRKAAGVRRFGDIATEDLMPMNNSGSTYEEMTSVMNGVLGEDHDLFAAIADSPVKKKSVRRPIAKVTPEIQSSGSAVASAPIEANSEAPAPLSASQTRPEQPKSTAGEEASSPVRPAAKKRKHIPRVPSSSLSTAMEVDESVIAETAPEHIETTTPKASIPAERRRHLPRVPSSSLSTAMEVDEPIIAETAPTEHTTPKGSIPAEHRNLENIFSPSSPAAATAIEDDFQPGTTPNSVRKREEAGARAVTQLLSSRRRKFPPAGKKLKGVKYGNAAVEKAKGKAAARKKMRVEEEKSAAIDESGDEEGEEMDVDKPEAADPADDEAVEEDTPEVADLAVGQVVPADQDAEAVVLAPKRMFALFTGNMNNYYPATWLAISADGLNHQVKFDDLTVTTVAAKQACRLELHIGDIVKVDLPKMRKQSWTIVKLVKASQSTQSEALTTDIFGHTHVKVQAKSSSRTSLANGPDDQPNDSSSIKDVPITCIYLTLTMWTPFQTRPFRPPTTIHNSTGILRTSTPSATTSTTPSARNTPSTSSRPARARVPTIKAEEKLALTRDEPMTFSAQAPRHSGIFTNMAFAISYITSDSPEKTSIMHLIAQHGGTILEDGFEELVLLPPDNDAEPPAGRTVRDLLRLRPEYQNLGFTALLADHHSRRAKYMQALALSLPTLSGRWILDSCASGTPLPWGKYLLPSGASSFLNDAVRSRTLLPYDPCTARLEDVLRERPRLLEGEGVLMVNSGGKSGRKGGGGLEKRRTFLFLNLALGAGRVRGLEGVEAARRVLNLEEEKAEDKKGAEEDEEGEGKWRWVYVDCKLGEAGRMLFGKGEGSGKKKKGKGGIKSEDGSGAAGEGEGRLLSRSDGRVMLVNDEFVIQSLILGDWVERWD